MKKFSTFVEDNNEDEDEDQTSKSAKRALLSTINSNFQRVISQPDGGDNRSLLIMLAALGVLNSSDDPQSLATAKRLATLSMSRKPKKEK